jgi:mono/diheme cytochrome c family protein
MIDSKNRPSLVAPLGGVVVGVAVFLGVNITIGRAIIPTAASISSKSHGLSEPVRPQPAVAVGGPGAGGPYQAVCSACHQADGKGLPGAFPPVAGSEWMVGNPEVPVRIVLLGLTGPIEVGGAKYNAIMPPPAGMTDATIAEAISHARTNFGNNASKVTPEFVKQVRDSLAGRTTPWTSQELAPLLKGGGKGGADKVDGAAGAPARTNGGPAGAPAAAPAGR